MASREEQAARGQWRSAGLSSLVFGLWSGTNKGEEATGGGPIYADMCCLSSDRKYIGLLRRHSHGWVFVKFMYCLFTPALKLTV